MHGEGPRCLARTARLARTTATGRGFGFSSNPTSPSATTARLAIGGTTAISRRQRRQPKNFVAIRCAHFSSRLARCPAEAPKDVAVLGGGLTGLTTAWYLTQTFPDIKVTLYEGSERLGGWIDTKKIEVEDLEGNKGTVLFERGARTIPWLGGSKNTSWDDLILVEMAVRLGIRTQLSIFSKDTTLPSYIYYPDHLVDLSPPNLASNNLSQIFASVAKFLHTAWTEPVLKGAATAFFNFMTLKSPSSERLREKMVRGLEDVSVGHFVKRLSGGPELADNLVSAMVHGIYGGDVWTQSMMTGPFRRIIMGLGPESPMDVAEVESFDYLLLLDLILAPSSGRETYETACEIQESRAKYLFFKDGFSTLTDALAKSLEENPRVTVRKGDPVTSVRYEMAEKKIAINTSSKGETTRHDKAISTLFSSHLAGLVEGRLPVLEEYTAVTILLVNLWYPIPRMNEPHRGFGYLLPLGLSADQNPESILGVIFDSDREWVDEPDGDGNIQTVNLGGDSIHGTKLTVMMGGHLWDGLPEDWRPDDETAINMAKQAVARHLRDDRFLNVPAVAATKLCKECIPQQKVGHVGRMKKAHEQLEWMFEGRLAVAGPSYQAPGVLSSLRAARDIAWHVGCLPENEDQPDSHPLTVQSTGLGRFGQFVTSNVWKPGLLFRCGSGATLDLDDMVIKDSRGNAPPEPRFMVHGVERGDQGED